MVNHFSFPIKELPEDDTVEGRTMATISLLLPLTILLDAIREELELKHEGKAGRSLFDDQPGWYGVVGRLVSNRLGVPGHECVLRFVCEMQQRPLAEWSLLGQLLEIVFTPRYGNATELLEYATSERLGRWLGDPGCRDHYPRCPGSLFQYMESFANLTTSDEEEKTFKQSLLDPHLHTASFNMIM